MIRHTTTLYDTLGVSRDATSDVIRRAFRKLTFDNHPDRFSGEQRLQAEERFQTITEAFNVLSRPESREKYDRELGLSASSGPGMDRAEIARRLAGKGAQSLRDGRLAEALEQLKHAIDHDDACSRAHYFMGMALIRAAGRERDALRHLERAASLEPNNTAIKAEVAQLCLQVGLRSRAMRMAEEVLALDPTSTKAAEVLQIAQEGDGGAADGLLSRFRRKG